jgi:hypothetical protein
MVPQTQTVNTVQHIQKVVEYARTPVNQYVVPGPTYTVPTGQVAYGGYGAGFAAGAGFGALDANKDGVISQGEWAAAGYGGAAFAKLDRNGDGVISAGEYAAGYGAAQPVGYGAAMPVGYGGYGGYGAVYR